MGVHCILWKVNNTCMVSTGLVAKCALTSPFLVAQTKRELVLGRYIYWKA